MELTLATGRTCEAIGCSLCCKLPAIKDHDFLKDRACGTWCEYAEPGVGCTIYEDRPQSPCRGFYCAWRSDDSWPEKLDPRSTGCVVHCGPPPPNTDFECQITIWEDRPGAWHNVEPRLKHHIQPGVLMILHRHNGQEYVVRKRT